MSIGPVCARVCICMYRKLQQITMYAFFLFTPMYFLIPDYQYYPMYKTNVKPMTTVSSSPCFAFLLIITVSHKNIFFCLFKLSDIFTLSDFFISCVPQNRPTNWPAHASKSGAKPMLFQIKFTSEVMKCNDDLFESHYICNLPISDVTTSNSCCELSPQQNLQSLYDI